MAVATSTLLIGAAALGAVSNIAQGISAQDNADKQAEAYEQQAAVAEVQGDLSLYQQQQDARDAKRIAIAKIGRGSSSVSGSYLENLNRSITNAALDKNSIEYNTAMAESNYLTQADNARSAGDSAMMNGIIGAGSSLLSGYANVSAYNSSIPKVNAVGQGVSGGNVSVLNSSYTG